MSGGLAGLRGAALRETLRAVPFSERDAWVDARLGFEAIVDDAPDLPRECVPYLPAGVEEILALVDEAPLGPGDRLVDIGAGLGRVVVLAHLLTGARAQGVEIQAHLVADARRRAQALDLPGVSFVHGDAAGLELDGDVFFLYTPCSGGMLAGVLRRLETLARRRRLVLATVGLELGELPWLRARPSSCLSLTFHDSCG